MQTTKPTDLTSLAVPGWPTRLHQRLAAVLLFAATALAAGCSEAHPRNTLAPVADSGEISAWFYHLLLGLDVLILAIVVVVMAVALVRFRRKPGDTALPEQSFGNIKLEVAWTIIPTLIVIGITVPTLGGIFELSKKPDVNQKIIEIDVIGKQWWWEFDYKREGLTTANELHVEVGTQVQLNITSADVIHAYWVPRIAGKRDATPGRVYPMYFRANEVGEFTGQCAELCGASHALMGTKIIVHPRAGEDSYEHWVEHMKETARKPTTPQEEKGLKVFMEKGCTACHTIQGVAEIAPAARKNTTGPDLTHVGSRTTIAALTLPNDVDNLAKWIKDPQSIKQGALMLNLGLTDQEARDVATYLFSLK